VQLVHVEGRVWDSLPGADVTCVRLHALGFGYVRGLVDLLLALP
jgi:hypothetical protein